MGKNRQWAKKTHKNMKGENKNEENVTVI